MNTILTIALVIAALVAAIAIVQLVRYEKELRRMARFLKSQEEASNARLGADVRSRGFLALGQAANDQLSLRHQDELVMKEKDRELRDGFAYLSHDIRTPLMGARGYLQLALSEQDEEAKQRYITSVDERLGVLQRILDQLFLFTRVNSVEYPVDCRSIVLPDALSEVLVTFYPHFESKGWTPEIELEEASDAIWADPDALKRIFENLLMNMIRHGEDAPKIEQHGNAVTFSNTIRNPEELDTTLLFQRFYKGEEAGNDQGSGLGLAIVSQLANAMQAEVSATIEENIFRITVAFKK